METAADELGYGARGGGGGRGRASNGRRGWTDGWMEWRETKEFALPMAGSKVNTNWMSMLQIECHILGNVPMS